MPSILTSPMKRVRQLRKRPRELRTYVLSAVVAVGLLAAYLVFLEHHDARMAAHYETLRAEHPGMYLEEMAELKGFRFYVDELAKMRGYDRPQVDVPPFLMGRWMLFDEAQNVSDRYFPEACLSGVEIEDGRVRMFGLFDGDHQARFTMNGMEVDIDLGAGGHIPLKLVSYGTHLHHVELTLPGESVTRYGYLCK